MGSSILNDEFWGPPGVVYREGPRGAVRNMCGGAPGRGRGGSAAKNIAKITLTAAMAARAAIVIIIIFSPSLLAEPCSVPQQQ